MDRQQQWFLGKIAADTQIIKITKITWEANWRESHSAPLRLCVLQNVPNPCLCLFIYNILNVGMLHISIVMVRA